MPSRTFPEPAQGLRFPGRPPGAEDRARGGRGGNPQPSPTEGLTAERRAEGEWGTGELRPGLWPYSRGQRGPWAYLGQRGSGSPSLKSRGAEAGENTSPPPPLPEGPHCPRGPSGLPLLPAPVATDTPVGRARGRGLGRPPHRARGTRPASPEGSGGDPGLARGHSPAPAVYERL